MEYVTIASTGNATDFGDLSLARYFPGTTSNSTRGVFMGGYYSGGDTNTMDYITIASTGNATDYGDTAQNLYICAGASNSHGGIS